MSRCRKLHFLLLLIFQALQIVELIPINNGVEGQPNVQCNPDSIEINFSSQNTFYGKIFVKGQSRKHECIKDYTQTEGSKNSSILVALGTCNVDRKRKLNPKGVYMGTTVVVQFHPIFLTKIDRAYHVKCFYQEAFKIVSNQLQVSMLATTQLSNIYGVMPVCTYSIRRDSYDGPPVQFLRVGDPIFHRWDCSLPTSEDEEQSESPYGMLVHSCYVDDGVGNSVLLVDMEGCGMDPYILGHLTYSENLLHAYREAHMFKFADKNILSFSCQIRLCFKTMDTCDGMTPPKCLTLKNKRSVIYPVTQENVTEVLEENRSNFIFSGPGLDVIDVETTKLIVFDPDDLPSSADLFNFPENDDDKEEICISRTAAAALWIVIFSPCFFLIFATIVITRRRKKLERLKITAFLIKSHSTIAST